jgi:hypothetical protein
LGELGELSLSELQLSWPSTVLLEEKEKPALCSLNKKEEKKRSSHTFWYKQWVGMYQKMV